MTCEQCYVCEQTVLQCSRTMLLAMTYDLCHGGHMVAEYPLLHTLQRFLAACVIQQQFCPTCQQPAFSFRTASWLVALIVCSVWEW